MMNARIPQIDQEHLFLLFLFYSFTGWLLEEIWVSVLYRKIEKRGMLHGPVCPIYGFGALAILFGVYPWRETWLRLFLASAILSSALEYFSSWLLETIFHTKWWDYSAHKFNLNGRICLLNSTAFGLGGVAAVHFIQPFAERLIFARNFQPYVSAAYYVLSAVFAADIIFTVKRLVKFSETMEKLKMFGEQLKEKYGGEEWFCDSSLHEMILSLKKKMETDSIQVNEKIRMRLEKFSRPMKSEEKLFRKFPTMSSVEYKLPVEHIRETIKERIRAKKAERAQKK